MHVRARVKVPRTKGTTKQLLSRVDRSNVLLQTLLLLETLAAQLTHLVGRTVSIFHVCPPRPLILANTIAQLARNRRRRIVQPDVRAPVLAVFEPVWHRRNAYFSMEIQ